MPMIFKQQQIINVVVVLIAVLIAGQLYLFYRVFSMGQNTAVLPALPEKNVTLPEVSVSAGSGIISVYGEVQSINGNSFVIKAANMDGQQMTIAVDSSTKYYEYVGDMTHEEEQQALAEYNKNYTALLTDAEANKNAIALLPQPLVVHTNALSQSAIKAGDTVTVAAPKSGGAALRVMRVPAPAGN